MARKPAASRHSKPDGGLDRLVALLQRGQLLLWPLCIFLLVRIVLPALADITPPGVSLAAVRAAAERGAAEKPANAWRPSAASGADHACQHKCVGLRCPEGWTTAPKRDADGACKCICARLEDDTAWDRERREQQAKLTRAAGEAEAAKPERDPLHGPRDHAEA